MEVIRSRNWENDEADDRRSLEGPEDMAGRNLNIKGDYREGSVRSKNTTEKASIFLKNKYIVLNTMLVEI